MLRVVIADDEALARAALRDALTAAGGVEIAAECASGRAVVAAVHEHRPHAVFLDIEMPGMSGLQAAEMLEPRPLLVFVTAYDEYAVAAFGVEAVDYVLKPVDEGRVAQAVRRIEKRLLETPRAPVTAHPQRFIAGVNGKLIVIETKQIEAVEAQGNYVRLHTARIKPLLRGTLRSMEERLDANAFVRIHRSFLVNLGAIRELRVLRTGDYEVLLRSGATVPMSRTYRDVVTAKLSAG